MIELFINADSTPWFSAETGNLVGALGGAGIGIFGGTLGAIAGIFAPQGKGRNLVLRSMMIMAALGLVALAAGVIALANKQPYHVWYPMVMMGALLAGLFGGLTPLIRKRYQEAEARRLDADALRRS